MMVKFHNLNLKYFIHIMYNVRRIQLYAYDVDQALLNTQLDQGKLARLARTGQIIIIKQLNQHGMALIRIQEPAPLTRTYTGHPSGWLSRLNDFRNPPVTVCYIKTQNSIE